METNRLPEMAKRNLRPRRESRFRPRHHGQEVSFTTISAGPDLATSSGAAPIPPSPPPPPPLQTPETPPQGYLGTNSLESQLESSGGTRVLRSRTRLGVRSSQDQAGIANSNLGKPSLATLVFQGQVGREKSNRKGHGKDTEAGSRKAETVGKKPAPEADRGEEGKASRKLVAFEGSRLSSRPVSIRSQLRGEAEAVKVVKTSTKGRQSAGLGLPKYSGRASNESQNQLDPQAQGRRDKAGPIPNSTPKAEKALVGSTSRAKSIRAKLREEVQESEKILVRKVSVQQLESAEPTKQTAELQTVVIEAQQAPLHRSHFGYPESGFTGRASRSGTGSSVRQAVVGFGEPVTTTTIAKLTDSVQKVYTSGEKTGERAPNPVPSQGRIIRSRLNTQESVSSYCPTAETDIIARKEPTAAESKAPIARRLLSAKSLGDKPVLQTADAHLTRETSQVGRNQPTVLALRAKPVFAEAENGRFDIKSNHQFKTQTGNLNQEAVAKPSSDLKTPKSSQLQVDSQTSAAQPKVTAHPLSNTPIQNPWPQSLRFKRDPPLAPGTICISTFLKDEDIKQIMPDLDEVVLTRARRRAEDPRAERALSRRRSSSHRPVNGFVLSNGVKETKDLKDTVSEESTRSSLAAKPSSSAFIQVNTSQVRISSVAAKPDEGVSTKSPKGKGVEKPLERNIDNVIFGDVTFKAWYPSWYPKEIIGEKGLNGDCKGIVVSDLYVCKRCFGYAKAVVDWVRHTRCCEKEVPGEKVYTHGPAKIWSVWEVDGDVDTLYCQNLSLFAKLFLDNKSVFFDVSGFKYFLLVHTSPTTSVNQVVGFFSKEKMSWDNNNLACILIFPPWQRKSLGTLLMGVSYAISRREQILGGPEKPISDLGKRGYRRYWGAEIARWLLDVKESDKKKGRGMITVNDVSQGTWIVPEDCLTVLREMGVVEVAGKGKGEVERVRVDKVKVREWVTMTGLKLESVVDEGGFIEGYSTIEVDEDVEMED